MPLADFADDDFAAALRAFRLTARRLIEIAPPLRSALAPPQALRRVAAAALDTDPADALAFFERHFEPRRLAPGFLTGYYEPEVSGSLTPTADFTEPILARPGATPAPCPDRAEIEAAGADPIVWLADAVETFMIQVQGSARVRLPDRRLVRLVYDGRNGKPYTSVGRALIEAGEIPQSEMSLARLKGWLRAAGVKTGERGRAWLQLNRSFVYFRLDDTLDPALGPIGGAGAPLTPLGSLAVDRALWPYGLPFAIAAELPWRGVCLEPFRKVMIAQDTGSAIVGPARFDLFFGSGEAAGERAGAIRHRGEAMVLWPREAA